MKNPKKRSNIVKRQRNKSFNLSEESETSETEFIMPNNSINITFDGDSTATGEIEVSQDDYIKARDIANSIPIFSGTTQHASLDEFEYAVRANLLSIPNTDGRKEEYIFQILKRLLPPAKFAVSNKNLKSVSDILKILVKRFRKTYDFTHYLNQTRLLVKFANEPLECFLDRLAALVHFGMRSVEDSPEANKLIFEDLLNKEAIARFKEYATPAVRDSIRRAKAKKIDDVMKVLDSDEFKSAGGLPTPEIIENSQYQYVTGYPTLQTLGNLSTDPSTNRRFESNQSQSNPTQILRYPVNQQYQARYQDHPSSFTPTPSGSYENTNYGQQSRRGNIDLVGALLEQYLPKNSQSRMNATETVALEMNSSNLATTPVVQELLRQLGIQAAPSPVPPEDPQPSIHQIKQLATILAATHDQPKPATPVERRSDEMKEIKEILKDLVLEIRKQNRSSSPRRLRERSSDRNSNSAQTSQGTENPFAPNLSLEDLNELLACRTSASTGPSDKSNLHRLSSTHPKK